MTQLLLQRLVGEATDSTAPSCLVCRRQCFDGKMLHCGLDVDFPIEKLRAVHKTHFSYKANDCRYYSRFPDSA